MPRGDVSNFGKAVDFGPRFAGAIMAMPSVHVVNRARAGAARIAAGPTCTAIGGERSALFAAADGKSGNLLVQLPALALRTGGML